MKKCTIICNGNVCQGKTHKKIIYNTDIFICADGGYNNAIKLGIKPNYVIGDLDSINYDTKRALLKSSSIKLIQKKSQNSTDLEKAILLAKKLKFDSLIIIGAIGNNMDHTLANMLCLIKCPKNTCIIDEKNKIFLLKDTITLNGKKGDIISIIPIGKITGLKYLGIKWNIKNNKIPLGWFGTRNRMTGKKCQITLKKGFALVMKCRE